MLRTTLLLLFALLPLTTSAATPSQALGYAPKYGADFDHFDYVNPAAPKGGALTLSAIGSFDSLNPFTLKGIAADGLSELMFETLMVSSLDEPFSQYGLLADAVTLAPDRLSVTYHLHPAARFSDGSPVEAEDVKFSFDTLKGEAAHPQYRFYWSDIAAAEVIDSATVRFRFRQVNPELHLIVGQIPIFSRQWLTGRALDEVVLEPPLSSGPYRIERFDLGKNITYVRNPDYWAAALPTRRGMFNFDRVSYRYYRDATVALEAFKAGEFDFTVVYNSKQWARDYRGHHFDQGELLRRELPHSNNAGMQGFAFNTRRPLFQDRRVREALTLAFDFEWANQQLFYNQYTRCDSYFSNSELAATGVVTEGELALLEPFRSQLPATIFDDVAVTPPRNGDIHTLRNHLRRARDLLAEAGWHYRDGALRQADGTAFKFDIMLGQKAFERIVAPYARNLERLGIEVSYRVVDSAIYQRRAHQFDFDMLVQVFPQSPSPGNELRNMFHSEAAAREGSRNTPGISDPVVDALVDAVIYASDRTALVTAARALDRVLRQGYYLVPNWYIPYHRIAYRDQFAWPQQLPQYYQAESWMVSSWWQRIEER